MDVSMSGALFHLALRKLWQLLMVSFLDRHLSLSTGVLKGSQARRRNEISPGI